MKRLILVCVFALFAAACGGDIDKAKGSDLTEPGLEVDAGEVDASNSPDVENEPEEDLGLDEDLGPNADTACTEGDCEEECNESELFCDGIDDDCDGTIDEDVCNECEFDDAEPNDSLAEAATLQLEETRTGYLCGEDREFFRIEGIDKSMVLRLNTIAQKSVAEHRLTAYMNGVALQTVAFDGHDFEAIELGAAPGYDFVIEVERVSGGDAWFTVGATDSTDHCDYEDAFAPNFRPDQAYRLFEDWPIEAVKCEGPSDFYDLGEFASGERINLSLTDSRPELGESIVHLLTDPEGDGSYTSVANSEPTEDGVHTIDYLVEDPMSLVVEVQMFGTPIYKPYELFWTRDLD